MDIQEIACMYMFNVHGTPQNVMGVPKLSEMIWYSMGAPIPQRQFWYCSLLAAIPLGSRAQR